MTYSQLIAHLHAEERAVRMRHRLHIAVSGKRWMRGQSKGRIQGGRVTNSTWNVPEQAALFGARVCVG